MGSGFSKTGVSKKGDSKPKINSQVQPLSYKKMEEGQESGHSQTNYSKTDLNSNSSASKADGDINAEEPKLQSTTDNTDRDGGVKHETAHFSAHDDHDDQQANGSDNVRTEIDDTNIEQSKSNNSVPKEDDNTSSTLEDKEGMSRESESGQDNTSENIGLTDDTDNHDTNLTKTSEIEATNESNSSLDIDEKTEASPSTLASHTTTSNDVEFHNNLNDNTVDSGHAVTQSGDVDKDTQASAQSNANENPPLENSKDKKKEEAELSEYRLNDNVLFYRNKLCSKPFPGATIEEMLTWKGDYQKLERSHSYIQWLFPMPESRGMNYSAQPLQEHEAQIISKDEDLRNKVLEAFKMMLDFYGMEFDSKLQRVKRTENWEKRYDNLKTSTHNNFRITRIIKAIGELGWKRLQVPWIEFIMHEVITTKALSKITDQTMCHFIDAVKEEEDKWKLYGYMFDLNSHSCKQDEANESNKQHNENTRDGSGQLNEGKNNNGTFDSSDKSAESVETNGNETKGEHGDATCCDKVNEIGENDGKQNRSDSTDKTVSKEVTGAKTKQGDIHINDTIEKNNCKSDESDISSDNCTDNNEIKESSSNGEMKINDTMAEDSKTNGLQGKCGVSEIACDEKETSGVNGNGRHDNTANTCEIDDDTTKLKDENLVGKDEPIIVDKNKHGVTEAADVNTTVAVNKTRNDGKDSLKISCGDKTTNPDSSIGIVNNTGNDKDGSENMTVNESVEIEEKRNENDNGGSNEMIQIKKKNKQKRDGSNGTSNQQNVVENKKEIKNNQNCDNIQQVSTSKQI